jgi:diamine N-acetyltransferase
MIELRKLTVDDTELLVNVGSVSFVESHVSSGPENEIKEYVETKYSRKSVERELKNEDNIIHGLFYNGDIAAYSKIVYCQPTSLLDCLNVTQLERIYVLKKFYELKLGQILLDYNVELSKSNDDQGMWLNVWKGNERAIGFYKKNGFVVIGHRDYKLTERHSNPNYQMFLKYH